MNFLKEQYDKAICQHKEMGFSQTIYGAVRMGNRENELNEIMSALEVDLIARLDKAYQGRETTDPKYQELQMNFGWVLHGNIFYKKDEYEKLLEEERKDDGILK